MAKIRNYQSGFGAIETLLLLLIVGLIGFTGWYVYSSQQEASKNLTTASTNGTSFKKITKTSSTTQKSTATTQIYQDKLLVKEWGLQFTIPSGLADVKYVVNGDVAAIYAKPTGSSVEYRSDYEKFDGKYPQYAVGVLVRSKDATNNDRGFAVDGKKVGDYYYYTSWSFSGLASGAACVELYGSSSDADCTAEATSFTLVNGNDGNKRTLLYTIQLLQ